MEPNDFYRLINTLLYKAHEKIPPHLIPHDEHLVTDRLYYNEIRSIINKITGFVSQYSPQFEFQTSPFNKDKIIPVVTFFECSRMFAYRKEFDLKLLLKSLDIKL